MRAWTVDADDIRVAEDFDESLLYRTPEIDTFLTPDRDDKFIVIGTKGFGKTLLLKAKRVLYQRDGQATCLPTGNLLDKPIGDKIFGRESIALFSASPLPWSKVWLSAIALAVLKHVGNDEGLDVGPRLAALVADRQLHSVIDHFVRLLDFTPSELQRAATDTDGHLVPRLRALNSPLALFIDGIDEYFNKHVEDVPASPSVTGELSPNVWFFAQLGLVEVAYQLRRINHHLKIFAAIRKEAYARLPQRTAMVQQYRGSAVDIVYSPEALHEIFVNNVRLVRTERMVRPDLAKTPAAGGLPRLRQHRRHLHARGGGRVRVRLPPHAAQAARPDDDRRAADGAASRRAPQRVPPQGGRQRRRHRDRARVPGRDRALRRRPRARPPLRLPARPRDHARRGGGDRRRRRSLVDRQRSVQRPLSRRPARLRPARPGARRMAPALPAPGRSHVRDQRAAAARDPLPRPSRPLRRDRAHQPRLPAAHRPRQHRRLRPALARDRAGRPDCSTCASAAC